MSDQRVIIGNSLHCLECGATAEWMKKEAKE